MNDERCEHKGGPVLLVEGQNDCHIILALKEVYGLSVTFDIHDCGSDVKALQKLNSLIPISAPPRVIGLVIDADSPDLVSRWQSIQDRLSDYDYVLPDVPDAPGTIVEPVSETPRLGFWLMPNNAIDGMLEDFCIDMIDPKAVTLVKRCLTIAKKHGYASYKETHRQKAILHTYLAWQDKPGRQLEHTITTGTLRPNTATAQTFADWLTALFHEP